MRATEELPFPLRTRLPKRSVGTAVVVLPLYNLARLVAEIATADALSNGRLMLGVGAGYQPYEFERFGVDIKATSIAQGSARR
jgi:alkanesulfonate monooxygenase SsuD/methylene tetrahydromethanopterin reductase-like flavin-dependent oxidoreductase (luciferase family)